MSCPFKPFIHNGVEAVGVSRCGQCGAFTNDPPELKRYVCKGKNQCVEDLLTKAGIKIEQRPAPKHQWGDMLAQKLDSLGITKERWTEGLVALNLTTYEDGCNCADRQRKLNELGEKIMGWFAAKSTA